jgi:hypothetical protein
MAGIKISALPAIPSSALADIGPFVQGGTTYKATLSQIATLFNANLVLSSTAQVTGLPAALAALLPLAGGTMTGVIDMGNHKIINLTDPTNPQDAATMAYVQTFASGITVILSAYAASTANVPSTQAGAGVGATLTDNSGTFAAFSIDGVSPPLNSRILIKDQTASANNGVYDLTTNGDGISIPWQLTRSTDYDTNTEIVPGTLIAVNNGTVNASTSWLETATVAVVDTDPVLFSQFTFAPSAFFQIANNLSEGVPATMRTNLGLTAIATATVPLDPSLGGTGVINANTITLGGDVVTSGDLTTAGAFAATFTFTGATGVTFPTTGTLLTSAQPTINQPNIVGTTTNDSAAAGSVGEFISSVVPFGSSISMAASATVKNITSIALTAGDWDVWGNINMFNSANVMRFAYGWISATSATIPDASLYNGLGATPTLTLFRFAFSIPAMRFSLAVPTTIYLSGTMTFSSGTSTACGGIYARRVR